MRNQRVQGKKQSFCDMFAREKSVKDFNGDIFPNFFLQTANPSHTANLSKLIFRSRLPKSNLSNFFLLFMHNSRPLVLKSDWQIYICQTYTHARETIVCWVSLCVRLIGFDFCLFLRRFISRIATGGSNGRQKNKNKNFIAIHGSVWGSVGCQGRFKLKVFLSNYSAVVINCGSLAGLEKVLNL